MQLWRDAVRADSWWDKLRIGFMRTGWRPADVAERYPLAKPDLARFSKFEVPLGLPQKWYAGLQFALYVVAGTWLLGVGGEASLAGLWLGWAWMAFGLYALGVWLENRPWARPLELVRLLANWPTLWAAAVLGLLPMGSSAWWLLALYSLVSLAALFGLPRRETALVL
ncbi:hypothetical protein D3C76_1369820 [compost metagenome]